MNERDKKTTEGKQETDKQKKIKKSFDKLVKQNGGALKRLSEH